MGKVRPVPLHVMRVTADVGYEQNRAPNCHEQASLKVSAAELNESATRRMRAGERG
jgi:hypothetical protein